MSEPSAFTGYPYLAIPLTEQCTHFGCLPLADDATLRGLARRQHEATGLAVQLVLASDQVVLVDEFGECQRSAIVPCRYPLYDHLPLAVPVPVDAECAGRDVLLAEHCWRHTYDGRLAALAEEEWRRLAAAIAGARARGWRLESARTASVGAGRPPDRSARALVNPAPPPAR